MFALNAASIIVACTFAFSWGVYRPFAHLEIEVNHFLHIRQTDFIRGHFAFWIPALALALCLDVLLRSYSSAQISQTLLKTFGGVVAFLVFPAAWIYAEGGGSWLLIGEVTVIFLLFLWILLGRSSMLVRIGFAAVIGHFVFWFWFLSSSRGPNWDKPGYFGPAGPIMAFCAGLAWVAYVNSIAPVAAKYEKSEKT